MGYGWFVETIGLGSLAGVAGTVFLGLAFVYRNSQVLRYGIELVTALTVGLTEHENRHLSSALRVNGREAGF